jgi:septum formation protein
MKTVILASASPRRREILTQVGCKFTVVTSEVEEDNGRKLAPQELVMLHAQQKALDVARKSEKDAIVIGADTIVAFAGQVFGKPADEEEARAMLRQLSGKEHEVISGISVVCGEFVQNDFVLTNVRMKSLSAAEIDRYIATGEPSDKAGAYAIQGYGALLVESIQGCYNNVVGLPVSRLALMLEKVGVHLL